MQLISSQFFFVFLFLLVFYSDGLRYFCLQGSLNKFLHELRFVHAIVCADILFTNSVRTIINARINAAKDVRYSINNQWLERSSYWFKIWEVVTNDNMTIWYDDNIIECYVLLTLTLILTPILCHATASCDQFCQSSFMLHEIDQTERWNVRVLGLLRVKVTNS